jgi:hypothetical protein
LKLQAANLSAADAYLFSGAPPIIAPPNGSEPSVNLSASLSLEGEDAMQYRSLYLLKGACSKHVGRLRQRQSITAANSRTILLSLSRISEFY